MSNPKRLCLVEESGVANLEPLSLTRPSFDLRCGAMTLGSRWAKVSGIGSGPARQAAIVRPSLAEVVTETDRQRTVNDPNWLSRGPSLVAVGRFVPETHFETSECGDQPWIGLCQDRPVCAWVGPEQTVDLGPDPGQVDAWFASMRKRLEVREIPGIWVDHPWDLVDANAELIGRDLASCPYRGVTNNHLARLHLVGPSDRLAIHPDAKIDPCVVMDTTAGPILIARDAQIQAFTRIEGPCVIGSDTQLFRANLRGGVTLGPNCRIGGEVEQSIIQGHTNKYHDGFLGHAYLGEWVNLGAITSNSDLRNDYGEVNVPLAGQSTPTGRAKVGCFLGDHTRTGLGCLINTGTSVGVMCNLLPAGHLLPKYVPSFSAVLYGKVGPGPSLDQLFATAEVVLGRRQQIFSPAQQRLYRSIYEQTRLERQRLESPRVAPQPERLRQVGQSS